MVAFLCNKGSDKLIPMNIIGTPLFQWETGRRLQIIPLQNMTVSAVHFSNPGDKEMEALVVKPKEVDGKLVADIPNVLLQKGSNIVAYSVNVSSDCVETLRECIFPVRKRSKPADYVYTEVELLNYESLEKRIKAIEENSNDYILTDADKQEIAEMAAELVDVPGSGGNVDVTIDGETLVIAENSTATIDGETLIL